MSTKTHTPSRRTIQTEDIRELKRQRSQQTHPCSEYDFPEDEIAENVVCNRLVLTRSPLGPTPKFNSTAATISHAGVSAETNTAAANCERISRYQGDRMDRSEANRRELQQRVQGRKMQQCTFKSNINRNGSVDTLPFLMRQQQHQRKIKAKIETLKLQIEERENKETTFSPRIITTPYMKNTPRIIVRGSKQQQLSQVSNRMTKTYCCRRSLKLSARPTCIQQLEMRNSNKQNRKPRDKVRHKEGVFHKEEMLGKLKYVKRNGGTVIGYTCKPDSLLVVQIQLGSEVKRLELQKGDQEKVAGVVQSFCCINQISVANQLKLLSEINHGLRQL